jgi:hypothetical protein
VRKLKISKAVNIAVGCVMASSLDTNEKREVIESLRRFEKQLEVVNKEEYQMQEPAFDGTVLEGWERRYTIINERDIEKYVPESVKNDLWDAVNAALMFVEEGREKEGKKPYNNYIVINVDEPYVDEIIEVMKRHGHWG